MVMGTIETNVKMGRLKAADGIAAKKLGVYLAGKSVRVMLSIAVTLLGMQSAFGQFVGSGACRGYRPLAEAVEFVELRKELATRMLKTEKLNLADMERVFIRAKVGTGLSVTAAAAAATAITMIAGVPAALTTAGGSAVTTLMGVGAVVDTAAFTVLSGTAGIVNGLISRWDPAEYTDLDEYKRKRYSNISPDILARSARNYFNLFPQAHSAINRIHAENIRQIDANAWSTTVLGYRIVFDLGTSDLKVVGENIAAIKTHVALWKAELYEAEAALETIAVDCDYWKLN